MDARGGARSWLDATMVAHGGRCGGCAQRIRETESMRGRKRGLRRRVDERKEVVAAARF